MVSITVTHHTYVNSKGIVMKYQVMSLKEAPELMTFSIIGLILVPLIPVIWVPLASHVLGIWVPSFVTSAVS